MSLRRRLALAVALAVLAPLVTVTALLARAVPRELDARLDARLVPQRDAASAVLRDTCSRLHDILATAAVDAADRPGAAVDAVTGPGLGDAAVVLSDSGADRRALAERVARVPDAPYGLDLLHSTGDCSVGQSRPGLVAATEGVVVPAGRGRPARRLTVVVAVWLDRPGLQQLMGGLVSTGDRLTLVAPGLPTLTLPADGRRGSLVQAAVPLAPGASEGRVHPGRVAVAYTLGGPAGAGTVVAVSAPRTVPVALELALAGVVLAVALVAGALCWQLARLATRPLQQLGDAAARVSAGDLEFRMPVRGRDEVARLAHAFNDVTDHLRGYVTELERSQDELRRDLARLGDTLSHTHDLDGILTVVLETAMSSVRASAGAVLLATAQGELVLRVGRGVESRLPVGPDGPVRDSAVRVPVGEGLVGAVASSGRAERVRFGSVPGQRAPSPCEPTATTALGVPLGEKGRVMAVLVLYDRRPAALPPAIPAPGALPEGGGAGGYADFDDRDLETLRTFAAQAGIAIDNVLLHQEAQRLSITDGLTGLWNYRYLSMALAREVERAARFGRPLAVLLLDLDHFKLINDVHGHQRGDTVLVELATRVSGIVREVDVLARYGGEEFVLVLPETDLAGASSLADRVLEVVRGRPFGNPSYGEEPLHVTVSVGVAVHPEHGTSASALLRNADRALYAAKSAGRDTVYVARQTPPGKSPAGTTPPSLSAPRGESVAAPPRSGGVRSGLPGPG